MERSLVILVYRKRIVFMSYLRLICGKTLSYLDNFSFCSEKILFLLYFYSGNIKQYKLLLVLSCFFSCIFTRYLHCLHNICIKNHVELNICESAGKAVKARKIFLG